MTKDLIALLLLLGAIGWALVGWPTDPGGTLASFVAFLALVIAGLLIGRDRGGAA